MYKIVILYFNLGYVHNKRRNLWSNPSEGVDIPWSTISYANGLGFYDHFTNGSSGPWKDIRKMDFTNDQYRSPAMMPTFDEYETHGGEDVPLLANGPWAHLFVGVHEESYWCQAIEHAAGWGKYHLSSPKPNSAISLKSTWILSAVILAFLAIR